MIDCVNCTKPLSRHLLNTGRLSMCPSCQSLLRIDAFPALFRRLTGGGSGQQLQSDSEAGCFYHAAKAAVVPCDACGRFLCGLCDIEYNGRHLCPACFEKGKISGRIKTLTDQRICYDSIALTVALAPMLLIWPTIVTAPIAWYLVVRHWNAPLSIIPRSKIRFVSAAFIATVQLMVWGYVIFT